MTPRKKEGEGKAEKPKQIPESKLRSLAGNTRFRVTAALILSLLLHEPIYHEVVKDKYAEVLNAYNNWNAKREKARLVEISTPEIAEALNVDEQKVSEINEERLKRIEERREDEKRFKQSILDDPEGVEIDKVFFPLEYYSLGVEEDEMRVARELFRVKNDLIDVEDPDTPTQPELKTMVDAFAPPGSHNRIRSSAVHTLAHNLGPGTQNCVARARLMAMSVATKYPEFKDKLFLQEWGDHIRTLVEVNGKRIILEGPVETFPDQLTDEKRNQVMPLDVWLQIYAGRDVEEFEDEIEFHGPPKKSDKENYPRVTDDLIGNMGKSGDLDNVGSAEDWFALPGGGAMPGCEGGGSGGGGGGGKAEDEGLVENGINLLNRPHEKRASTPDEPNEPHKPWIIQIEDSEMTTSTLENIANNFTQNINEIEFTNLEKLDEKEAKLFVDWIEKFRENNQDTFRIYRYKFPRLNQFKEGAATEFTRITRGELIFEGMNSLDEGVARSFGNFEGGGLIFNNLRLLSSEAAIGLVGEEGLADDLLLPPKSIDGSSLAWFTVEPELKEGEGGEGEGEGEGCGGGGGEQIKHRPRLEISGLAGLSQEAGQELSLYNGSLNFQDCDISEAGAKGLAPSTQRIDTKGLNDGFYRGIQDHESDLTINDKTISEEMARGVAGHKGDIRLTSARGFEGNALALLMTTSSNLSISSGYIAPTEALQILVNHKGEELEISVGKELTEQDAEIISTHEGLLVLHGLQTITPEVARILIRHNGPLKFDAVNDMTPEAAEYFAQFEPMLTFSGRDFSNGVMRILSQKPGGIEIHQYMLQNPGLERLYKNRPGATRVSTKSGSNIKRNKKP